MRAILSIRDLAWRLGVSVRTLQGLAEDARAHYKVITHYDEKKKKVRILYVPDEQLKLVQRKIKSNILDRLEVSAQAHGGVRGRSPRSNAREHLGQPCVVNLDVRDFFPSVRHYVVYRMFRRDFEFGRDVARLLTKLTTLRGGLPQGTSTSTRIANLLLSAAVDTPIAAAGAKFGVKYTRFVDDVTLSGRNPRSFINLVAAMLSRRRLRTHRKNAKFVASPKLRISGRSNRQEVTGLVVNNRRGPSVSKSRRDSIKAAIHQLPKFQGEELDAQLRSIQGRIRYVLPFNPRAAAKLMTQLGNVLAQVGR
jgi:RNA-directed DNA polymerase